MALFLFLLTAPGGWGCQKADQLFSSGPSKKATTTVTMCCQEALLYKLPLPSNVGNKSTCFQTAVLQNDARILVHVYFMYQNRFESVLNLKTVDHPTTKSYVPFTLGVTLNNASAIGKCLCNRPPLLFSSD